MLRDLIPIAVFLGTLLVIANLADRYGDSRSRRLFYAGVVLLNLMLLFLGAVTITNLLGDGAVVAEGPFGFIIIYSGVAGLLLTLPPVRRFLDRRSAVDAGSAVHMSALLLAGYVVGQALGVQFHGGLETLANADVSGSLVDVVANQALYLLLGLLGVGLFIRRDTGGAIRRLGLSRPTWRQIRYAVLWIPPLVILQAMVGTLGALFDPEQARLLEEASRTLLAQVDTLGEWFVIGIAPGISEEVLFRGAVQPVFGLWATAGLFAIAHAQYALSPATIAVFLVGLSLGYIRRKEGTSVAILVHFGYNFVLGLISLLASTVT